MNRRRPTLILLVRFLLAPLLLGPALVGCNGGGDAGENEPSANAPAPISSVPLRVVVEDAEVLAMQLRTSWAAVSEQPLEVRVVAPAELLSAAAEADVVLFSSRRMGDLQAANALTALPEVALSADAIGRETVLAALEIDQLRWGSEAFAVPLGAPLPVVWVSGDLELPESSQPRGMAWPEYTALVKRMPPGRAAEPLADGWSAYAFLARAASQTAGAWLFDRQTLAPRITDPPYQRALEQLVEDAKQYPEQLLTPDQIWEQLASDQLDVAIGWPTTLQTEDAEQAARLASLQMVDYPRGAEVYLGTWQASLDAPIPSTLPPRGMVAAIAATCRQTTIARNLLNHLADAEAREQLRSTTDWVWPLRDAGESDGGLSLPLRSRYDALLRAQLAGGQIRPSLRLPGARRYLQALDQNVRRAIAGEHDADQALAEVAEQWEAITEALGRRKQVRAWRQAQGMRAR